MVFSSIPFLFYFLPAALILYFTAPRSFRNTILLIFSLFFYGYGEPKAVSIMIAVTLATYLYGLWLGRTKTKAQARIVLFLAVLTDLAALIYFKYADFAIQTWNLFGGRLRPLHIALPIGISFFTFQAISYLVDVYRRDAAVQKNPAHLALYIMMFPQLIAGPIVRYADIAAQLKHRVHTVEKAAYGVRRFVIGLAKKVLIANVLAEFGSYYLASTQPSILFVWLNAVAFTLQIYFDFSGYSDMAIGLGKLFGFDFKENFQYPYIARSVTEFWRRWHISLGTWFRDYVYIPLGGNRVPLPRHLLNILVVWALTGLWHGAGWNFVIWGLYFGLLLVIEKLWLLRILDRAKRWNHLYLYLAVTLGFVLFQAQSLTEGIASIGAMFGAGELPLATRETLYYAQSYGWVLALAAFCATPLPSAMARGVLRKHKVLQWAEPIVLSGLLVLVTAFLVDGSFNPFLYFRF